MNTVTFSLKQLPGEAGLLTGVLRQESEGLVLEWRRETQFYPRRSVVQTIVFPWEDLAGLELRTGWFRAVLVLTPRKLTLSHEVPGIHPHGSLHLHIPRSQRSEARKLASVAEMKISSARLDRAEDPLEL